jgi:hypothetical protein
MQNSPGYDDRARSFADTPLFTFTNAGVCVIAAIAAVACWTCWAVTFTPWGQYLPSMLFIPFFVLMFPLFGWSVWLQTAARRPAGARRASADWMKSIPRGGRVLVALAVAAAVAGGATAASTLGGQRTLLASRSSWFRRRGRRLARLPAGSCLPAQPC